MSVKCAIRAKMEPLVWTPSVVTAVSALKTTEENTVMKVKLFDFFLKKKLFVAFLFGWNLFTI